MMKSKKINFLCIPREIMLQKNAFLALLKETVKKGVQVAIVVLSASMSLCALAGEIDLNKTMVDNCDRDGNGKIYGRKAAKENHINMAIARKEFKCKMAYDMKEAQAKGKRLKKELYDEIVKIANDQADVKNRAEQAPQTKK